MQTRPFRAAATHAREATYLFILLGAVSVLWIDAWARSVSAKPFEAPRDTHELQATSSSPDDAGLPTALPDDCQ